MQGSSRMVEVLNELLTMELTAINQYFVHAKMCENWGYARLAKSLREASLGEMKDAEDIIERVLYFEGIPNLQRLEAVTVGENAVEQLRLALETEKRAVARLAEGIAAASEEGDNGTREMLAEMLTDQEKHIDWLETQISLVGEIGEPNYLSQQVRD
jgi:bacterioferritin